MSPEPLGCPARRLVPFSGSELFVAWRVVGAMGRYSTTEMLMAAAATAAFLFIFSLTVVPRPQPSPATFDLASFSKP